jgi:hypothetical protein
VFYWYWVVCPHCNFSVLFLLTGILFLCFTDFVLSCLDCVCFLTVPSSWYCVVLSGLCVFFNCSLQLVFFVLLMLCCLFRLWCLLYCFLSLVFRVVLSIGLHYIFHLLYLFTIYYIFNGLKNVFIFLQKNFSGINCEKLNPSFSKFYLCFSVAAIL